LAALADEARLSAKTAAAASAAMEHLDIFSPKSVDAHSCGAALAGSIGGRRAGLVIAAVTAAIVVIVVMLSDAEQH
jgi:hypothetical protein